MSHKKLLFLFANFISSVGDAILYFGLPISLTIAKSDIRYIAIFFLIPAINLIASFFFNRFFVGKEFSTKKSYPLILVLVGLVELIIGMLAYQLENAILVVVSFVFLYSLAKEAIPRLYFSVDMIRLFSDESEYSDLAKKTQIFSIVARFLGTFLSGVFLLKIDWQLFLLIDALTFIPLIVVIYFFGRSDVRAAASSVVNFKQTIIVLQKNHYLFETVFFGGISVFVSTLVLPYVPVTLSDNSIMEAPEALQLVAIMRLLISIVALKISTAYVVRYKEVIIRYVPLLYVLGMSIFVIYPSFYSLVLLYMCLSFYDIFFVVADLINRNSLDRNNLLSFGKISNLFLGIFQLLASCIMLFFPDISKGIGMYLAIGGLLLVSLLFLKKIEKVIGNAQM